MHVCYVVLCTQEFGTCVHKRNTLTVSSPQSHSTFEKFWDRSCNGYCWQHRILLRCHCVKRPHTSLQYLPPLETFTQSVKHINSLCPLGLPKSPSVCSELCPSLRSPKSSSHYTAHCDCMLVSLLMMIPAHWKTITVCYLPHSSFSVPSPESDMYNKLSLNTHWKKGSVMNEPFPQDLNSA